MSDANSPAQVQAELDRCLKEVARLSEMITVLKLSHAIDEQKLAELSAEWITANLRVSELREELKAISDREQKGSR
jgi:predicted  nucleic acid-binding Zn-ribbon protein